MKRLFAGSSDLKSLPPVLSIVGPTGSGKTAFAQKLSDEHFHQKGLRPLLVSVDAVALYRGLDIGAAKPNPADIEKFGWVGINLVNPDQSLSVRAFIESVQSTITQALKNQTPIVLVGGSLFYERALVEGMSPGSASDPTFAALLASVENSELASRLYARDERFKLKIHPNDRYRLTRYLDLTERQGLGYEELFMSKHRPALWEALWTETITLSFGLDQKVELLRVQLEKRLKEMFAAGWIEECRQLRVHFSSHAPAFASVGYAEIMAFLEGKIPESRLYQEILTRHLQLAKKQRTWLRGMIKHSFSP